MEEKDIENMMKSLFNDEVLGILNSLQKIYGFVDRLTKPWAEDGTLILAKRSELNKIEKAIKDIDSEYQKLLDYMKRDPRGLKKKTGSAAADYVNNMVRNQLIDNAEHTIEHVSILKKTLFRIYAGCSVVKIEEDES